MHRFLKSAGVLLLITALAKLVSAGGSAAILRNPDPIFVVSYRTELFVIGCIELIIAAVCLIGKRSEVKAALIAGLATSCVLYRICLLWVGATKYCKCLGNLVDNLHIDPRTADIGLKLILAYLLIGGYTCIYYLWREKRSLTGSVES
jgi:hypothetical protein